MNSELEAAQLRWAASLRRTLEGPRPPAFTAGEVWYALTIVLALAGGALLSL